MTALISPTLTQGLAQRLRDLADEVEAAVGAPPTERAVTTGRRPRPRRAAEDQLAWLGQHTLPWLQSSGG